MADKLKLIVLKPGEGQKVNLADMVHTMKATGEDTLGGFGMWESEIKGGPGPHIHRNEEEAFYVLEGEVEFRLGDASEIITTGGFALIPRGTVHAFTTLGEKPARLLVLASPAGFEHFFEEVEYMRAAGMDSFESFKSLGEKFNMTVLE